MGQFDVQLWVCNFVKKKKHQQKREEEVYKNGLFFRVLKNIISDVTTASTQGRVKEVNFGLGEKIIDENLNERGHFFKRLNNVVIYTKTLLNIARSNI